MRIKRHSNKQISRRLKLALEALAEAETIIRDLQDKLKNRDALVKAPTMEEIAKVTERKAK